MGVRFLTMAETAALLRADADGYLRGLSRADLSARAAPSAAEYARRASASADDFSTGEMARTLMLCDAADAAMRRVGRLSSHFDLARVAELPWILAKTRGGEYEGGWPHTRGDVVFLSGDALARLTASTLAHEKVHVFQRRFPDVVARHYVDAMGFRPTTLTLEGLRAGGVHVRSNPDLDGRIYEQRGKLCYTAYQQAQPRGMGDVYTSGDVEHPNEALAYHVGDLVARKIGKKYGV